MQPSTPHRLDRADTKETLMNIRHALTILSAAVALGALSGNARAENNDDMSFSGMFKVDRIDKNKDRMVSKAEFMEMMGKVWDMKAKEMKVANDKFSMEQYQQILMYMKAGG